VAAKYSHLLPESVRQSPSSVVWLSFHRAVMADLVNNASEEELEAITEFTQARLGNDVRSFEQPWDAFSGGEDGSEVIKKRNYLERYVRYTPPPFFEAEMCPSHVKALPDSIEAAFQDVEDITNFRMFSFVGGPSPGGGSLSVMNVQTGCSRNPAPGSNGSFESFLGDLYSDLKHKWVQWLATTYSKNVYSLQPPRTNLLQRKMNSIVLTYTGSLQGSLRGSRSSQRPLSRQQTHTPSRPWILINLNPSPLHPHNNHPQDTLVGGKPGSFRPPLRPPRSHPRNSPRDRRLFQCHLRRDYRLKKHAPTHFHHWYRAHVQRRSLHMFQSHRLAKRGRRHQVTPHRIPPAPGTTMDFLATHWF